MILHIVNKSPFQHSALSQSLCALSEQDSVILIEDGVLLLTNPDHCPGRPTAARLFVLESDCAARGLAPDPDIATVVNFDQFVELVALHNKTISWF